MATTNKTFSVKNGIDVANTIIVDSNRNLSNIANVSIRGLINAAPTLATNTSTDSAFRIVPNTQAGTPEHRNIFRVSSYYNAGVNGHDFFVKTDDNNRFVLASDWGNALRIGVCPNSGSVANAVPSTYFSISTTTASFVGVGATFSGNVTVDTNVLHVDSVANRVGINRTDPGASLDVTSSAAFAARITGPANVYQDLTDGTGTARLQLLSNAPILTSIGSHALMFGTNNTERVRIDPAGNVVIGATSTLYKLEVAGAFAAQTKSFVITHPTKPDMKLRYGSLEGPENGVYVRGRSKNGIIKLPDYWTGLVDESTITVNLTPVGAHQKLYVEEIVDNTVIVGGGWFDSLDFFYTVYGERKDVDKLIVEI